MHVEEKDNRDMLFCAIGKTVLHCSMTILEDLHAMLKIHRDWMELGSVDEQITAKEGTVETWVRSESNPVGGWHGLKKGLLGRQGMYIPPQMEAMRFEEGTCEAKGNKKGYLVKYHV